MRKIILDLAVTLDSFIEGPHGETDWCIMDEDMNFSGFLSGIDSIFYGRISYDMWNSYVPEPTSAQWERELWSEIQSKHKVVFSSTPRDDERATWISADIQNTVAEIRQQKGKDIWLFGGAKLIATFIDLDLIDMYRLSVHPVILGKGKPLFGNLNSRINLKLAKVNRFKSGVVQLIYEKKDAE